MATRFAIGASYAMLCVIWGSTWLAIKIGLAGAPPFLGAALRFALAFVVLVPILAWRRARLPRTGVAWALIIAVGILLYTLDYGLIYWGEDHGVESGLSSVLFATFVFQTAIFAHVLLASERVTLQKLAGIGVGFAGILLIFRSQLATAGVEKALPMAAIVLAATCAAFSSVAAKRWGRDTDPIPFTALSMMVGTLGLFGLSAGFGERWDPPAWPDGVLTIVFLALVGSVIAFVTYWWLLQRIGATSASYIGMVTPIVAVFLGFTIGDEVLDWVALGGAGVTIGGIYLSTSKRLGSWLRMRAAPTSAGPDRPT